MEKLSDTAGKVREAKGYLRVESGMKCERQQRKASTSS